MSSSFNPNPYSVFDPSQWSNQFSQYQNGALPWPSSYVGMPYNSMGQPIQPPPGMTLNSSPAAAAQSPAAAASASQFTPATPQQIQASGLSPAMQALAQQANASIPQQNRINPQMMANATNQAMGMAAAMNGGSLYGTDTGNRQGPAAVDYNSLVMPLYNAAKANQPAAAAPPPAPSGGLTAQQYMAMRANPGPVTTPGATVPQSATSYQPSSGALAAFLQNWKPATSGPGSGFQQGFYQGLKGQGY